MLLTAYKVEWDEYERGWGQRPDGYSLHKTKADAEQYIKDYWAKMPAGSAPDEYSSPGTPRLVEVTAAQYDEIQMKINVRYWR